MEPKSQRVIPPQCARTHALLRRTWAALSIVTVRGKHSMALLEVDEIETFYGNIQALKGVSLNVNEGEIVTLIGSNGAGKTTTLRTISAMMRPKRGQVRLAGSRIDNLSADKLVEMGI